MIPEGAGVPISRSDIERVETLFGRPLPRALVDLWLEQNGGMREERYWLKGGEYHAELFLPIKGGASADSMTMESEWSDALERGAIDRTWAVFAVDPGGNLFCLDERDRVQVVFLDKSPAERRLLAASFAEFVAGLSAVPPW